MNVIVATIMYAILIGSSTESSQVPPELQKYVCKKKLFSMPESVKLLDVNDAQLLVKANPDRYESHLLLALALVASHKIESAVDEFEVVDRLAAEVSDPDVLAQLPYDDFYAMVLFIAAERRIEKDPIGLKTLRILQKVLGMDTSMLREKKILSRCYGYVAFIYMSRGSYDAAIRIADVALETAWEEGDGEMMRLIRQVRNRAKVLKEKRQNLRYPEIRSKVSKDLMSRISSATDNRPKPIVAPDHKEALHDR